LPGFELAGESFDFVTQRDGAGDYFADAADAAKGF
jgi:hypothetical protein